MRQREYPHINYMLGFVHLQLQDNAKAIHHLGSEIDKTLNTSWMHDSKSIEGLNEKEPMHNNGAGYVWHTAVAAPYD